MNRTWQDNAAEFAALDQGEGWPFAVLVACSVERGTGGPRTASIDAVKVSAREFAEAAGTSDHRVARYLSAWDRAAELDVVIAAVDLTPNDVRRIEIPDMPFSTYYDASKSGGRQYGNVDAAVQTIEKRGAAKVVAALSPEQQREVVREVVKQADPATFDVIREDVRYAIVQQPVVREDIREAYRIGQEREEERKKAAHTLRFLDADASLERAKRLIRDAINTATGVEFSDQEREDLADTVKQTRNTLDLLASLLTGTTDVDWDAELTKLGGAK